MDKTYKPNNLKEALELLNEKELTIFAGGTDIAVKTKQGKRRLFNVKNPFLFLSGINEITQVFEKEGWIYIGSATVYSDLLKYYEIPDILKQAIKVIASPAIRNLGTIGGNICNSSPAGDTLPALYCLDAILIMQSINSQKEILISDFIVGPGKNILKKNQLLTYIKIKKETFEFQKFIKVGSRKAQTISKVSVAFLADKSKKDIRIAFGAVGPTVRRDVEKEKKLKKIIFGGENREFEIKDYRNFDYRQKISKSFESLFSPIITPIDDQRSTAQYRKSVALKTGIVLLNEFLNSL